MSQTLSYLKRYTTGILFAIIIIFNGGSLFLLAIQSTSTERAATSSAEAAKDARAALDKQDQILAAIQKVTIDTNLTQKEQTKIIICMLKVPIAQRTDDIEQNCRREASASTSFPNQATKTNNQDTHQHRVDTQQTPTGNSSGSGSGLGNQQPSILPLNGLGVCTPRSIPLNGMCISN